MGTNPDLRLIDADIRSVVTWFNKLPFVETLESCSGHEVWRYFPDPVCFGPYLMYQALDVRGYSLADHLVTLMNSSGPRGEISQRVCEDESLEDQGLYVGGLFAEFCGEGVVQLECREFGPHSALLRSLPPQEARSRVKAGILEFWKGLESAVCSYNSLQLS